MHKEVKTLFVRHVSVAEFAQQFVQEAFSDWKTGLSIFQKEQAL
jgi:hypothetical protein